MSLPRVLGCVGLFLSLAILATSSAEEKKAAPRKPAATPEEAVKQLSDAVQAEDAEAVKALITNESRKVFQDQGAFVDDLTKGLKLVFDAMDEKFGKDPNPPPTVAALNFKPTLLSWVSSYWKIDIVGKEEKGADKVELKVKLSARPEGAQKETRTRADKIVAVREEGGWRLLLSEFVAAKSEKAADPMTAEAKALKAALEEMNASYEDFAKQVKAGKYPTREQASRAFARESRRMAVVFASAMSPAKGDSAAQVEHRYVAFDVAPNDKQIVFSSADGDLYLLDLERSQVRQVMKTDAIETSPSFSPDGKQIAYAAKKDKDKSWYVFLCSLDGKEVKQLTSTPGVSDIPHSFSPDGSQIAFVRAHRHRPYSLGGWTWDEYDVYVMNSNGKQVHRVTKQNYYQVGSATFSRDGKSILYSADIRGDDNTTTIFAVDASGADTPTILAKGQPKKHRGGAWAADVAVSPDGSRVAFISDRGDPFHYDVFVMERDGADPKPLGVTSVSKYNQKPVFLPDGKSVMFLAGTERNAGSRAIYSLWQVDIDGNNPRRLADSSLFTKPLSWQKKP